MNTTPQLPPEQLARILGTKFYAARHPVEFEAAISELTAIIRERDELKDELKYAQTKLASVWLPKDQENADKVKAERDSFREKANELDKIRAAVLAKVGYATVTLNEVVQAMEKAEALDWLERNKVDVQYHVGDLEVGVPYGYEFHFSDGSGQYSKAFPSCSLLSAINSARKEQSK
jgi:hypothetical protein